MEMNENIKLTQLHTDVLRKFALNLDINSIFNLCVTNKRFDELICKNQIFLRDYGGRYLSEDDFNLPRDKKGNYLVLQELAKLERLLSHTDIGNVDERWKQPIFFYLENHDYEKYLLNLIDRLSEKLYVNLFFSATKLGYLDAVKKLINKTEKGILINRGQFALFQAISKGDIDMFNYLLSVGVPFKPDINNNNRYMIFRFKHAFIGGNLKIINYFIANGMSIDDIDYKFLTSLLDNNLVKAKEFLDNGANIHVLQDAAIWIATKKGDKNMLQFLHNNGGEKNPTDSGGGRIEYPIFLAAKNDNLELVKYFLDIGIENEDRNILIKKTLERSIMAGHINIIKYLLSLLNTDVVKILYNNIKLASRHGYLDIVKYLMSQLEYNISETYKSNFELEANIKAAMYDAKNIGYEAIYQYLNSELFKIGI